MAKPSPRSIAIFIIMVLSIALAIFVGLYSATFGDPECNCIKRIDAGWRATSILLVIMLLFFILLLFIYPETFRGTPSP